LTSPAPNYGKRRAEGRPASPPRQPASRAFSEKTARLTVLQRLTPEVVMKKPGWLDKQRKQAAASVASWPEWMRREVERQAASTGSEEPRPPQAPETGAGKGTDEQGKDS
jgi:hypothetical protein